MTTGGNTLDDIVREWARTQIQQQDIVNYNGAQLSYNHQSDMANRLGLTDRQKLGVTPFPCPTNQTLTVGGGQREKTENRSDSTREGQNGSVRDTGTTGTTGTKTRAILWPTIGAAALSSLLTAGGIGGAAWYMRDDKPREQTTQTNPESRVGVDVIGWPNNLISPR